MRLIDADALLKHSARVVEYDEAGFSMEYNAVSTEEIKNEPTIEAVPVVTGSWTNGMQCSKCGQVDYTKPNFCPNCGADMRKKVE